MGNLAMVSGALQMGAETCPEKEAKQRKEII